MLPYNLQAKDIVGPTVSIIAALISVAFAWINVRIARQNANRSAYIEGQKFLIAACKQLLADPVLWCIYDNDPLRKHDVYKPNDELQRAKLRAFAHLHLNMFEIVIEVFPRPGSSQRANVTNVWYQYFEDTMSRCQIIREILEEPGSRQVWSGKLLSEYARWRASTRIKETQGA
jgi:hypothetical protein